MKDKEFYKNILKISIPIAMQSLINVGVSMTDTMMLGRFGEITLSGAALANQFCFMFLIINFGLGGGVGVLSGQFWGNKDIISINKVLSLLVKLSFSFGVLFLFIGQFLPYQVMSIYTNEIEVINEGASYLKIVSLAFIFQGISTTTSILFRTLKTVKPALFASIISFFINIFLNWVFIFGNLGMPSLGIKGAAIATLSSRIFEFIFVLIYVLKIDNKIKFRIKYLFEFDKEIFSKYLKVGSPVLISDIILGLGINMVSVIMGQMGSDMVSANSISSVVLQFTNVFLMGVSNASGVITGNTVGEKNYDLAFIRGKIFLFMSIILGCFSSVVIYFMKYIIVDFYNVTDHTKSIAYSLMNATSFLVIFMSVSHVLTKGVLRAGGDTKFLMIADVLFLWIIAIPLGYLAGVVYNLSYGLVLICLKIDEIIKSTWCVFRLFSKKWIKNISLEDSDIIE